MTLEARFNGAVLEKPHLDDLVVTARALTSHLSDVAPLVDGDIIATGTPGGIGAFREPPVSMARGNTVEAGITGVGLPRSSIRGA